MTGMSEEKVNHFLKLSLANLQLDYVDLYLIHFPAGCVYENDNNFPARNPNGEVTINPKSSYLKVWKVSIFYVLIKALIATLCKKNLIKVVKIETLFPKVSKF